MMDFSSAVAGAWPTMTDNRFAMANKPAQNLIEWSLLIMSNHEIAAHEGSCLRCRRLVEKVGDRTLLADRPVQQKDHIARDAPHLAEIMGGHHDLDAGPRGPNHDVLDAPRRGGIEIGGGLVEQQQFRVARPRVGAVSPMQSRSRLVFPAPFGPTMRVGAPDAMVRLKRSSSLVPPASSETSSST